MRKLKPKAQARQVAYYYSTEARCLNQKKTPAHESDSIRHLQKRETNHKGSATCFPLDSFLIMKLLFGSEFSLLPYITLSSYTTLWLSVYFPYFNKHLKVRSMVLCTLQISTHLKLYCTSLVVSLLALWFIQICIIGTSLVEQWLSILLPKQGTRVRALVWEDPTCRGATKPVHHNYWACTLEPVSHNYWACMPQLLKPTRLEPMLLNKDKPPQWEARTPQQRVAPARCN